eukprot:7526219-Pyramimonas_sp.AAC.1
MPPQPGSISSLRLPTLQTTSGRSFAVWMSGRPAPEPPAARPRLSATNWLGAARKVEAHAGKTAFGETVATVSDRKQDNAKQVASRQ